MPSAPSILLTPAPQGPLTRLTNLVRSHSERIVRTVNTSADLLFKDTGKIPTKRHHRHIHGPEGKPLPPLPQARPTSSASFDCVYLYTPNRCQGFLNKEIWECVIASYDPLWDRETLCALILVNRAFRQLAEGVLYSSVGEFTDIPQYSFLLRTLEETAHIPPLVKRLTIANTFSSFMNRSIINLIADVLPKLINLTELVFDSGNYTRPSSYIFRNCSKFKKMNLRVLEWSSCVADEEGVEEFLRTQDQLRVLKISWRSSTRGVKRDAVPALQTLIGDTDTVLSFLPGRPVGQLQWTGVGNESDDTLRQVAHWMGAIRELSVEIQPSSRFSLIAQNLVSARTLELIISEADNTSLSTTLHSLPHLHTLIFSTDYRTPFHRSCVREGDTNLMLANPFFLCNESVQKIYIQKPSLSLYRKATIKGNGLGSVGKDVKNTPCDGSAIVRKGSQLKNVAQSDMRPIMRDGPRIYECFKRDSLVSSIVSENLVFGWKEGYVPYPVESLGKVWV